MAIIGPTQQPGVGGVADKSGLKINYSGFFTVDIDVSDSVVQETSILELFMTESLLSPTLETSIRVQSSIHPQVTKNYDEFRGANQTITAYNPNIDNGKIFTNTQTVYRMENRKQINYQIEEFTLHACDPTLIHNHLMRVSQQWPCRTPTQIVSEMFDAVNAVAVKVEPSSPGRPYLATNIHPFQVISEQADVALADGSDPSFIHFMTFEDKSSGKHHFESIHGLTEKKNTWAFVYSEAGSATSYGNPYNIITYEFTCDFDLLSDILNGEGIDGTDASSLVTNPKNSIASLINGFIGKLGGMGGSQHNAATTDYGNNDGCPAAPENYTSLRQARLSLLQPEGIGVRIMVPFNPWIHAGDMIECNFYNKYTGELNYGSGDYMIVNLTHDIKAGGYGVSNIDLVSKTVHEGIT